MKLYVRHAGGELAVPDHKEFLLLWRRGIIMADDEVRREGADRWVRAADLPWIRGMREVDRRDDRRLFRLTVVLLLLALSAVLWLQRRSAPPARRAPAASAPSARSGVQFRAP